MVFGITTTAVQPVTKTVSTNAIEVIVVNADTHQHTLTCARTFVYVHPKEHDHVCVQIYSCKRDLCRAVCLKRVAT